MCRGRRSWPVMSAEAEAGLRPRTCIHVNARGRRPRGIYVLACPRPRVGRSRGRCDRPRAEAETSMFCARMAQPRFHMRNASKMHPKFTIGVNGVLQRSKSRVCMHACMDRGMDMRACVHAGRQAGGCMDVHTSVHGRGLMQEHACTQADLSCTREKNGVYLSADRYQQGEVERVQLRDALKVWDAWCGGMYAQGRDV
eukprot:356669-Chlamydomonas_euryale.AAC.4